MSTTFHFFTAVWGSKYTENFIEVVLPCALAPGNFGSCRGYADDRYFIYTTATDRKTIVASDAYRYLTGLVQTEIILFEPGAASVLDADSGKACYWDAWESVTKFYQLQAKVAAGAGAALVYLGGDEVWADGAFQNMRKIVDNGRKGIFLAGVPVKPEPAISRITRYRDPQNSRIIISPRAMVQAMLESRHEYCEAYYRDQPLRQNGGGLYYHPVSDEGLIVRLPGRSPVVLIHKESDPPWPIERGFELIEHVVKLHDWSDIHIVKSSDEIMMVSLELSRFGTRDYKITPDQIFQPLSVLREAMALKDRIPEARMPLLSLSYRWTTGDISAEFERCDRELAQTTDSILACKKFLEECSEAYEDLKRHFALIDTLREKSKRWLEFAAMNENLVELLPESTLKVELLAGLAWLYASDHRSERAIPLFSRVFLADIASGVDLMLQLLSIFELTGRKHQAESLVDVVKDNLCRIISGDMVAGYWSADLVVKALERSGWSEIATELLNHIVLLLNEAKGRYQDNDKAEV